MAIKQDIWIEKGLDDIKKKLSTKKAVQIGVYIANRAATKGRKNSIKHLKSTYNISAKRARKNVFLYRARKTQRMIKAIINYIGMPPGLANYKAIEYRGYTKTSVLFTKTTKKVLERKRKRSLTVEVFKGKRVPVKNAFLITTKSGGKVILKRAKKGKYKFIKLFGPSLRGEMRAQGGADWILEHGVTKADFQKLAQQAVRRYMSKYAK
jgi:hypothetical protein